MSTEDPYDVLGVSHEATPQEIKKAYRKLALQHHPDKQTTEEAKKKAHTLFSKISHAYEILSDPERKREYDQERTTHPEETFFHDPFEMFERVFREEQRRFHRGGLNPGFGAGSFFQDPFFAQHDSMMSSAFGRSDPFDHPFFGGGMMGGGMLSSNLMGGSMMGGGMMGGPASQMNSTTSFFSSAGSNPNNMTATSSFSMSSSSLPGVSTSTTTRIVNGRRTTVTETTRRRSDGTLERQVYRDDGNAAALPPARKRPRGGTTLPRLR